MKRLGALVLALVLALSLSIPAFATTLTINEPDGMADAAYAGYKILNATNSANDTTHYAYTLNAKYSSVLQTVTGKTTEADIVAYIAALDADGMRTFANNVYAAIVAADIAADKADLKTGSNTVDEGYWLIAQTSAAPDTETQSLVIVDTAGKNAVTVESKKSGVTVDKTVSDENHLTCQNTEAGHVHTAACYAWAKANNCPIGSTVQFKIETAVPANMKDYKYGAYFIVGDTLSDGLTMNENSIVVTINGAAAAAGTDYTVKFAPDCADGYTFQIALIDPKAHAGEDVVVTYSAKLNKDAVLKLTGNPNEADVTYSNKPNEEPGGNPGTDGFPQDKTYTPEGKTPKSITITYSTGLQFQKVDGDLKALSGAEFTVTGTTMSTELVWKQEYTKVAEGGTYYLLTDGSYTTEAPITADSMEAQTKGDKFEGGYVVAKDGDKVDVTVDGIAYRMATEEDFNDTDTTIYTLVNANVSKYAETAPNYKYSEGWTTQTATKDYSTVVVVDENGIANLPGLAAGTYHIEETKTPAGYNTIKGFDVVISWTAPSEEQLAANGKAAQCTWTAKVGDQELSLTNVNDLWSLFGLQVINEAGTELPSTGGMGTTIFYALGSLLVVGAAVVLVTRKRMGAED